MEKLLEPLLKFIPDYINRLIGLISKPKSFILSLDLNSPGLLQKSLAFYVLSMIIALIVQIPLIPVKDGQYILTLFALAAISLLFFFVGVTLLLLCWRIVGGKADFKTMVIAFGHVASISTYIWLIFGFISEGIFKLFSPILFNQLRTSEIDPYELVHNDAVHASWAILAMGFVVVYIWVFVVWGAYRQLNSVSKLRSAIAYALYIMLSILALPFILVMMQTMNFTPLPRADLPKELLGDWLSINLGDASKLGFDDQERYIFTLNGNFGGYTHCQSTNTLSNSCVVNTSTCVSGHARVTGNNLDIYPPQITDGKEKNFCTGEDKAFNMPLEQASANYQYRILPESTRFKLCLLSRFGGDKCYLAVKSLVSKP